MNYSRTCIPTNGNCSQLEEFSHWRHPTSICPEEVQKGGKQPSLRQFSWGHWCQLRMNLNNYPIFQLLLNASGLTLKVQWCRLQLRESLDLLLLWKFMKEGGINKYLLIEKKNYFWTSRIFSSKQREDEEFKSNYQIWTPQTWR